MASELSDQMYRQLFDAAPDGILLVDSSGFIVAANRQIELLCSYSADALLGQRIEVLVPERFRSIHLTHRELFQETPSTRPMGSALDLLAYRSDGTEFPVEISLSPAGPDSKLTIAVVRDVTERRRVEAALRRSEERHRLIAEHSQDMIYRYRLEEPRGFEYVSPASSMLLGYSPEDLYSDPDLLSKLVHPDDQARLEQTLQAIEPGRSELRLRHRDGTYRWFEQAITPIRSESGEVVAVEAAARDITERRDAEEERQGLLSEVEAQLTRERVARDLHDDIIQSVYAVGLELRARRADQSISREDLVDETLSQLNSVIGAIRAYMQRLTAGPAEQSSSLEARISALVASSSGAPAWSLAVDLPVLSVDLEDQLFYVAKELISNVHRHSGASLAELSIVSGEGSITLVVRDDGSGFDPDHIPDGSFGLRGLSERATNLNGVFQLDSARGEGTTATLRIPHGSDLIRG